MSLGDFSVFLVPAVVKYGGQSTDANASDHRVWEVTMARWEDTAEVSHSFDSMPGKHVRIRESLDARFSGDREYGGRLTRKVCEDSRVRPMGSDLPAANVQG